MCIYKNGKIGNSPAKKNRFTGAVFVIWFDANNLETSWIQVSDFAAKKFNPDGQRYFKKGRDFWPWVIGFYMGMISGAVIGTVIWNFLNSFG